VDTLQGITVLLGFSSVLIAGVAAFYALSQAAAADRSARIAEQVARDQAAVRLRRRAIGPVPASASTHGSEPRTHRGARCRNHIPSTPALPHRKASDRRLTYLCAHAGCRTPPAARHGSPILQRRTCSSPTVRSRSSRRPARTDRHFDIDLAALSQVATGQKTIHHAVKVLQEMKDNMKQNG
jgi:hypothetical protein